MFYEIDNKIQVYRFIVIITIHYMNTKEIFKFLMILTLINFTYNKIKHCKEIILFPIKSQSILK